MIKVIEAEISHNKRLRSGLIERILYKPKSPYQIIVGPNGFGKSALLDEITAFPSASNAFEKNGLSRLVLETDHGIIETKTLVGSDAKHEFWLNGENLNDGGTASVQRDLVQKYLNGDKFSALIQSGQFSFSAAGSAKRQEVLTALADSDMSFANNLFHKARKKLSHATGAVNALEEALAEKEAQRISEEEYRVLKERLVEYQSIVTEVLKDYRETKNTAQDSVALQYQWQQIPEQIKSALKLMPDAPLNATDRAVWVERISKLKEYIFGMETRKKALQEEYDELELILKRNADASEENLSRLRNEVNYWERQFHVASQEQYYAPELEIDDNALEMALEQLSMIFPEWSRTLTEMNPDPEGKFTRQNYEELLKNRQRFQDHYNALSAKQAQYREQLHHLEQGKEVHCPQCKFHFIPGVSSDARPRLMKLLTDVGESLRQGEKAIEDNRLAIDNIETWLNQFRNLVGLRNQAPAAQSLFLELDRRVTMKDEPLRAVQVMLLLKEDLEKRLEVYRAKQKMQDAQLVLSRLQENVVAGIEGVRSRYDKVKEGMEGIYHELARAREEQRSWEQGLKYADQYAEAVDNATQNYERLVSDTVDGIDHLFNQTRLLLIQDLQGHIGTLTKTLNDAKTLIDQIDDLRKQLEKQKKKVESYRLLVSTLSPKSGVVAEQMNGFIKLFISQLNEVIAEIWTHPMELLIGKPNDTDLSYDFPLRLHDSDDYVVPDMRTGSDGQMKIIDFAFQITAMLYLNLNNVPLCLDEVDRPLSPEHKARLMQFITRGVENERFSQVFLISHHAVSHGALPFSDIIDFDFRQAKDGVNNVALFS
ncbi:SbcC-like subunit of palindrome specific endonuclease [Klebsiella phage vB_KpM_Centimanus]